MGFELLIYIYELFFMNNYADKVKYFIKRDKNEAYLYIGN